MRIVTVIDRDETNRNWGMGPFQIITRTIQIANNCPTCGGPRGDPRKQYTFEDGSSVWAHVWDNPCGHIDKYKDVIAEYLVKS